MLFRSGVIISLWNGNDADWRLLSVSSPSVVRRVEAAQYVHPSTSHEANGILLLYFPKKHTESFGARIVAVGARSRAIVLESVRRNRVTSNVKDTVGWSVSTWRGI